MRWLALALWLLVCVGCGQTGPLFLPGPSDSGTQVPSAQPPEEASEAQDEEE